MDEATKKQKKPNPRNFDYLLLSNYIFFAFCFAAFLPLLIKNVSAGYQFVLPCIALQIIAGINAFFNAKKGHCAAFKLPLFASVDIVCFAILLFGTFYKQSEFYGLRRIWNIFTLCSSETVLITFAVIDAFLLFFGLLAFRYGTDIFFTIVFSVEALLLPYFMCWRNSPNAAYGHAVLAFNTVVVLIWMFICLVSQVDKNYHRHNTSVASFFVLVSLLFYNICMSFGKTANVGSYYELPVKITENVIRSAYPWWLTILIAVLAIVGFIVLALFNLSDGEEKLEFIQFTDTTLLLVTASVAVVSKIITTNYFAYSFIIYAFLLLFYFGYMNSQRNKYLDSGYSIADAVFENALVVPVIAVGFVFITRIAENLLYVNLIATVILLFTIYSRVRDFARKGSRTKKILSVKPQMITLLFTCVETVGFIMFLLSRKEVYVMYAVVIAVCLVVIPVSQKLKPPANIKLPEMMSVRNFICIAAIVLSIVVLTSQGSKVKVEFNDDRMTAEVSVSSRNDASVASIAYKWDNSIFMNICNGEESVSAASGEIRSVFVPDNSEYRMFNTLITGERLTVYVTDSNGVVTTRTFWYPLCFCTR